MNKGIPPIDREEWGQILRGEITHKFSNFVLQIQIDKARKDVGAGKINEQDAADNIYVLCNKYSLAVRVDLEEIFKTW